jgi:hypothetical protein
VQLDSIVFAVTIVLYQSSWLKKQTSVATAAWSTTNSTSFCFRVVTHFGTRIHVDALRRQTLTPRRRPCQICKGVFLRSPRCLPSIACSNPTDNTINQDARAKMARFCATMASNSGSPCSASRINLSINRRPTTRLQGMRPGNNPIPPPHHTPTPEKPPNLTPPLNPGLQRRKLRRQPSRDAP